MLTLTPTKARINLSSLLKQAVTGAEIGILYDGHIVALRPVAVTALGYALAEYGLSETDTRRIAKNLHAKAQKETASGSAKVFEGDLEALVEKRPRTAATRSTARSSKKRAAANRRRAAKR